MIIKPKVGMWRGIFRHIGMGVGGGVAAGDTGWSDNFNGGTGILDNRTGWGACQAVQNNSSQGASVALENNAVTFVVASGTYAYILADYAPSSANYYVEYKVKRNADSEYIEGPIVRGSVGATGGLGYYIYDINAGSNTLAIHRLNDGAAETAILAGDAITNLDWTSYHTVRLSVSGTGATVTLNVYIDGNLEATTTDTSEGRIVTTGLGGIVGYWQPGYTVTIDDFAIGY